MRTSGRIPLVVAEEGAEVVVVVVPWAEAGPALGSRAEGYLVEAEAGRQSAVASLGEHRPLLTPT